MKVKLLALPSYKNLRNLDIEFPDGEDISVLVGRNGAGKSNVLEALTEIFRDLDLGAQPPFAYTVEYECRGRSIKLDANPERRTRRTWVEVDGEKVAAKELVAADGGRPLLPSFVFGYYSGPSGRLESHYRTHQRNFARDLRQGHERPLRRLFFARPVHSQFALLAFFLHRDEKMLRFLRDELWIEDLESVLFVMREPSWKSAEGDPRFWNARGTVQELLSKLYELAVAPMRRSEHVAAELGAGSRLEHLYLYLNSAQALNQLASHYGDPREFFKALESTYISELLSEVRIRVRTRHLGGAITFRELSEGEQQLLMVLGLLRFTHEDEALFLLDEPDTHLNPAWSQRYLELLRKVGGATHTSQILLATHDPLVVAPLHKEQVHILSRSEDTGQVVAEQPRQDPRGMGVAGLLTSDVYGLRSQLDLPTLKQLDAQRKLAVKADLSQTEKRRLKRLNDELERLGFNTVVRDPNYEQFLEALMSWRQKEGVDQISLTPEEKRQEQAIAEEIIAEIKQKGSKSG
jgi:ABC-type multidrug transport system ATPase subunit